MENSLVVIMLEKHPTVHLVSYECCFPQTGNLTIGIFHLTHTERPKTAQDSYLLAKGRVDSSSVATISVMVYWTPEYRAMVVGKIPKNPIFGDTKTKFRYHTQNLILKCLLNNIF